MGEFQLISENRLPPRSYFFGYRDIKTAQTYQRGLSDHFMVLSMYQAFGKWKVMGFCNIRMKDFPFQ